MSRVGKKSEIYEKLCLERQAAKEKAAKEEAAKEKAAKEEAAKTAKKEEEAEHRRRYWVPAGALASKIRENAQIDAQKRRMMKQNQMQNYESK